jgi:hypothetical protein
MSHLGNTHPSAGNKEEVILTRTPDGLFDLWQFPLASQFLAHCLTCHYFISLVPFLL